MKRDKIPRATAAEVLRRGFLSQTCTSGPLCWMFLLQACASEAFHCGSEPHCWMFLPQCLASEPLHRGAEAVDRGFYLVNEVKTATTGYGKAGIRQL